MIMFIVTTMFYNNISMCIIVSMNKYHYGHYYY